MGDNLQVLGKCPTTMRYLQPSSDAGQLHDCDLTVFHEGPHHCGRCDLMWTGPVLGPTPSGTPAGSPGVLEGDGSAAGEPYPPAVTGAPTADPPPPDDLLYEAWVVIANAAGWDTDNEWHRAAVRWRDRWHSTLPQTDGGAGVPPDTAGEANATFAPSSLTDRMRVERCRVLLDQWRKDRLAYPVADGTFRAIKECEDELREALEGP